MKKEDFKRFSLYYDHYFIVTSDNFNDIKKAVKKYILKNSTDELEIEPHDFTYTEYGNQMSPYTLNWPAYRINDIMYEEQ